MQSSVTGLIGTYWCKLPICQLCILEIPANSGYTSSWSDKHCAVNWLHYQTLASLSSSSGACGFPGWSLILPTSVSLVQHAGLAYSVLGLAGLLRPFRVSWMKYNPDTPANLQHNAILFCGYAVVCVCMCEGGRLRAFAATVAVCPSTPVCNPFSSHIQKSMLKLLVKCHCAGSETTEMPLRKDICILFTLKTRLMTMCVLIWVLQPRFKTLERLEAHAGCQLPAPYTLCTCQPGALPHSKLLH